MRFAIPSFMVGFALAVLVRWVFSRSFMFYEAFMSGLGVAVLVLVFGEKRRGLPTVDDLHVAKLNEEATPLGLADIDSIDKPTENP